MAKSIPKNSTIETFSDYFKSIFLTLDDNNELVQTVEHSSNDFATAAWLLNIPTPEYPHGRPLVLIGNDITIKSGSISLKDGYLFSKAVRFARDNGYPVVYISANSGAKIDISNKLMEVFKVKWNDAKNLNKGYEYLYLEPEDYKTFSDLVITEPVYDKSSPNETILHYKILTIISENDGGVENLSISGKMAGEFARAYEEIFTCSIVTLRAVGIGAYLARIGQRVIQVDESPLLLTGFKVIYFNCC